VAPPKFAVRITPAAERDIGRIDRQHQEQIAGTIDALENDARPYNSEVLTGAEKGYFRVRTGDYRIVYEIDYARNRVTVTRVGHRKEVYRPR
jgi:mRNA interferase RelE/StbE